MFDGNVRVERAAQKTDAQQLSRNLLLVPRATVNVKPNLQIVADDVKCTHGAAISDLEEEQLFYLQCAPGPPLPSRPRALAAGSWHAPSRQALRQELKEPPCSARRRQSPAPTAGALRAEGSAGGMPATQGWGGAVSAVQPLRRARGVDNATARRVLVYSFGGEVTAEVPGADLRGRIQAAVNHTLAAVVPMAAEAALSQEAV